MSIWYSRNQQIRLLKAVHRLAKAGIYKSDIADQLVMFGSATEQKIGASIINQLNDGKTFSAGIKKWLDRLAWESLAAGEVTGDLKTGVENALQTLEVRNATGGVLVKALLKPILGLLAVFAVAGFISGSVIPWLQKMIRVKTESAWTSMAKNFGFFVQDWGLYILCGAILFGVAVAVSLPIMTGRFRLSVDNFPVYRQYRLIQASAMLRSLGNLTLAKIPLVDSILSLQVNATPYLADHLNKMRVTLEGGKKNLGVIMDTGLVNPAELRTLHLLGEIGGVSETLMGAAEIHKDILLTEINRIKEWGASLIKIVATIIAVIIGGGLLSLMTDNITNFQSF
ncbi:type II secretory pathway component PulF [Rheinheimera pacifica]|uniref:type II secretion system F family protein n=1 Tax=Rheinheimera pacifica TaxID=173990 RepID=UPI0021694D49|nr:type II secretion system F family protein [Rheinheimera pacifica]MCS4309512.1 type II secretory pathway component PulF [Rheinheimera pacifica]